MNPDLLDKAHSLAQSHPRSLRKVGEVAYRDMVVYEDRATGERRHLSNKNLLSLGLPVAFELADEDALTQQVE